MLAKYLKNWPYLVEVRASPLQLIYLESVQFKMAAMVNLKKDKTTITQFIL